jgi:hypothetical protein
MQKRNHFHMILIISVVIMLMFSGFGNTSTASAAKPPREELAHVQSSPLAVSNFPSRVFAPYIESWFGTSLVGVANATGQKFFTMAFIIAHNGCTPTWNGSQTMSQNYYLADINNLRAMGGM